jgi:hypothetical protein
MLGNLVLFMLVAEANQTVYFASFELAQFSQRVILRLDRRIQELFSHTGNTVYSTFGSCDQVTG